MDPDPNRHRRTSNIPNPPHSQQNQQPVNASNVYQRQSNPNDTVDPYAARSPVGVDGGSFSQATQNQQEIHTGSFNPTGTGQQFSAHAPTLQTRYPSQRSSLIPDPQQPQYRPGASSIPTASYSHQTQQRANPPQGHQLQGYQDNIARAGPHVGASNNYGLLNLQPVNPPNVHHQLSYSSNTVGPHVARSPVGADGGSFGQQPASLASPSQPNYHSQRSTLGQDWNAGNPPPRVVQPSVTGNMPSSSTHSTNDASVRSCRLADCRRPRYFYNGEQLDYCDWHCGTAIDVGHAAPCRRCRRFPASDNSEYCTQSCRNADRGIVPAVTVPLGFAHTCQECRCPITENMEPVIHDGKTFCSHQCRDAYWRSHSGQARR
ncbi:hypothetical protein DFH94DRAFT_184894 [Russula ochroleuca]|jgi:hypothetical protein|uniref:Uncharacterized protein n=1 Tax=Russula ochroleuca TaxID=152965 RepID=A0A9P5N560_9AGAM|nr:hypothetical protein DFH94DRAFT_184894 [Russula ochroleuca]